MSMRANRRPHSSVPLLVLLMALVVSCDPERPPPTSATVVEPASSSHEPEAALDTAERPMLIVFSRDYCTPCRVMKPWVDEMAREHATVDIVSVNVDRQKYEHLGRFFQITAVPTLAFIDADGRVLVRREGLASKNEMTAMLRRFGWGDQ